jgi:hypothetical protein
MSAKDIRPPENEGDDQSMQDERADNVAAELVIGAGAAAVLELSSYDPVLTWFGSAG